MNFLKTHLDHVCDFDILLCNPKAQLKDLPCLDSVILSSKFESNLASTLGVLELLGLAKPVFTKTRIGTLHLSIRKGEVVGCKLRLRKLQINTFIESLLLEILPSQDKSKKLRFQNNALHLHLDDVFNVDDINNHISYLDGGRGLDVVILAGKSSQASANLLLFKSLGFNI